MYATFAIAAAIEMCNMTNHHKTVDRLMFVEWANSEQENKIKI